MQAYINEKLVDIDEGMTLFQLRDQYKRDADIMIYNAFPTKENVLVQNMDKIVFIKRGEMPKREELNALMLSRHTPFVHERMKAAKVGIAGLGGLGSNVAVSLARMGVGKLVIADFDVVEPSNLNRQNYYVRHIGMKKTEATTEILRDCNPFIEIESHDVYLDEEKTMDIFKDVDIIVEAFDNPACKSMLVNTALAKMKDKKIVAASGLAGYFSSNTVITRRIKHNLYIVGDMEAEAKAGCGLMAPRVAVAANHQANAVVRMIMGEEE